MRFSLDFDRSVNTIYAYAKGYVAINDQEISRSVIVTPERLITNWPPQRFVDLEAAHFEWILKLEPEIVLLGTGSHQQLPHPQLIRPLIERGLGVEVMDTAAACRTYNIIVAEGRQVAAALLMIREE